jgi:hypothetical protein
MGNIQNNYIFNRHDLRLSAHKYWDLYLSADHFGLTPVTSFFSGDTLASYIDFNNPNIYTTGSTSADTIYSIASWTGATNSGDTLHDIGLTGIDNGFITYEQSSGDTANTALVSAMTLSTLALVTGDTRLRLDAVTGNSGNYIYPIDILSGSVGNYAQFCGGFYQGFYKLDGYDYQTLPNRVNKGWVAEFWLKKGGSCSGHTGTTLNDTYPDNKGFFFFLGTRAENKFWNTFEGLNTGCTSECTSGTCESGETVTTGCTIPKETNSSSSTGVPLNPSSYHVTDICNPFLIYDRTKDGITACDIPQGSCIEVTATTYPNPNMENLYLELDRTKSGKTACEITDREISITQRDKDADIQNNAIGFRIKDDGSIGYRLLSYSGSCSGGTETGTTITGITMEEGYSSSGMVEDNVWTHIAVRFIADITYDDCELQWKDRRTGQLMFYVNGKLKYTVEDFDEFIARSLVDDITKIQGVPFNVSIGGGTQGLIESQTLDGPDPEDDNLVMETYFAGTFIGAISKWRFYIDKLCYCTIQDNYNIEKNNYT